MVYLIVIYRLLRLGVGVGGSSSSCSLLPSGSFLSALLLRLLPLLLLDDEAVVDGAKAGDNGGTGVLRVLRRVAIVPIDDVNDVFDTFDRLPVALRVG
jgi:hypothetical protein